MITLYGISQCDKVKAAQAFLKQRGLAYQFHDFKSQGLRPDLLEQWLGQLSAEQLVNRRSTTWRNLSEAQQQQMLTGDIVALCCQQPTLIKRPVLAVNGHYYVGFSADHYQALFS